MGLIEFGRYRVGFWMADRTSAPELPQSQNPPVVEGTPSADGVTLVLAAIDEAGTPAWTLLVHEPEGASLLLPWGTRLVVGLGAQLLFLDSDGKIEQRFRTGEEWTAGWPLGKQLLLLGKGGAHLIGEDARALWHWPCEADGLMYLDADDARVRLAAFAADDWREVSLDLRAGTELPA